MKITLPSLRRHAGFSLAEVTIATGITALALTTLLGLIPQGLNNIREAGNLAAETRITTHIIGAVSQARWQDTKGQDILVNFDQKRYYFDDQGVAIEEQEPGIELAYIAEVRVPDRNVALPTDGEKTAGDFDPYLRRITVNVTSGGNQNFNFERALPVAYRSHTTLIARTGK